MTGVTRSLELILVEALRLLRLRGDGHLPTLIREELRAALTADASGCGVTTTPLPPNTGPGVPAPRPTRKP